MLDDADALVIQDLYRSASRELVGYAMWLTGNVAEAEELVDDAFHDLCRQWGQVRRFAEVGRCAWLRRVIRNKAVSAYRKRRRLALVDPLDHADRLDRPTFEVDRVQALLACDLLDQCVAVIQTLPSHLRLAIGLRTDGLSSREIGRQLGVDSSTVRGYWAQVVRELNDKVGPVLTILDTADGWDGEEAR